MDSQCPGCLGQAVVTLRLPCAIVESPRRHKHVPFVNIASQHSRSTKRCQWKHKMDYCGVVLAHLATGCGINVKDPRGWIQIGECRTRGVARILLGLKPSRDSRATFQRDSPIWIQPLGVFCYIIHICITWPLSVKAVIHWEFILSIIVEPTWHMLVALKHVICNKHTKTQWKESGVLQGNNIHIITWHFHILI